MSKLFPGSTICLFFQQTLHVNMPPSYIIIRIRLKNAVWNGGYYYDDYYPKSHLFFCVFHPTCAHHEYVIQKISLYMHECFVYIKTF